MSLKVWLPMTGDLHNQGISSYNITSTDSSVVDSGKIGKCMKITKSTNLQYTPDFNNKGLSFGGWFKFNLSEIAAVVDAKTYTSTANSPVLNLIGNNNYGGIGLILVGNNHYTSGTFSSLSVYAYLRTSSINLTTSSMSLSFDTWTHIMLTWDPITRILATYKDGILFNSKNVAEFSNGTSRELFLNWDRVAGGNGPATNMPMYCNDVRIYDHCLSAAEVREIANGLVLHYKLDNNGRGGRNLVRIGTGAFHNTDLLTTLTWTGWDSYNSLALTDMDWNNRYGQQITYSCYVENVEQTAGTGSGIMLHVRYADGTYQQFGGGKNGTSGSYLALGESGWLKLTVTIPDASARSTPTTISHIQVSVRHNSSTGASTIRYKCPQAELGNKLTAWYWAPEDTQEDIAIVEDSSGYNHNGILTGNIIPLSDTAKYTTSLLYSTNSDLITIAPCFSTNQTIDTITVNCWFKTNTTNGTTPNIFCLGQNSFLRSRIASATSIWSYYRVGSTQMSETNSCKTLTDNIWHMLTFRFDKGIERIFIDGDPIGTLQDRSSTATYLTCASLNWYLGGYTGSSEKFIGSLSDFRIYCTPLLDTDIKLLYNISMKVDNKLNIHTEEFQEIGTTAKVKKTAVVNTPNLIEGGVVLNNISSYSVKAAANTTNSTSNSCIVDFSEVADLGVPVPVHCSYTVTWTNMATSTSGTLSVRMQGSNTRRSDGANVWEGANYIMPTAGGYSTNYITISSANGTQKFDYNTTVPASWFNTYTGSRLGIRIDYSDGNGTIIVSDIEITYRPTVLIGRNYIKSNEFIER